MTLPPERIGDKGQPYAAQAWRYPRDLEMWQDVGFSNTKEGAETLRDAILLHPSVDHARVKCRVSGGLVVTDNICPVCGSEAPCLCTPKGGSNAHSR